MFDKTFSIWVIFRPKVDKLGQMMRSQNGPITSEIVKVVHDDGNEEVQHDESAKEDEGDKVDVGAV